MSFRFRRSVNFGFGRVNLGRVLINVTLAECPLLARSGHTGTAGMTRMPGADFRVSELPRRKLTH